jgi:uncharacterized ion transporter superfamily protein YfcC
MINPVLFFKKFFSLLAGVSLVLLAVIGFDFLVGVLFYCLNDCVGFIDSIYNALATSLSLGKVEDTAYSGWWRIAELILEVSGLLFTGIVVAGAIKAIEKASD